MFCKQCGQQISDSSTFCPRCGLATHTKIQAINPNGISSEKGKPKKSDKSKKNPGKKSGNKLPFIIAGIIGIIIILAFILFFVLNGGKKDSKKDTKEGTASQTEINTEENTTSTEEDNLYDLYYRDVLIPRYGMYPFVQSGATDVDDISTVIDPNNLEEYWMDDVGIMGSQAVDLDKDGVDELFVVRMDAKMPNPDYTSIERYMYLSVYEFDGVNFSLSDEILWLPEQNGSQDISEIVFYSNPVVDKYAAVSLLDKGDQWVIFNEYKYAGELLNGVVHGYWTLTYDGSSFKPYAQYIRNELDKPQTESSSAFASDLANFYGGYNIDIDESKVSLYGNAKAQSVLASSEIEAPTVSLLLSSDGTVGNNKKNPMTATLQDTSPFHETYEDIDKDGNNGFEGTALQSACDEAVDMYCGENNQNKDSIKFGFVDLDEDGVPEFICGNGDYHAASPGVFTFDHGKPIRLEGYGSDFGEFCYEKGTGWVMHHVFGNGGRTTNTFYTLNGKTSKRIAEYYHEEGINDQKEKYTIDDESTSKENFYKKSQATFNDHSFVILYYSDLYDYLGCQINDYHDYLVEGSQKLTLDESGLKQW